ncbi:hypothetical protein [Haladaptatus sp. NG-SE-30]
MFDRFKNKSKRTGRERPDLTRDHRIEIRCPETLGLIATEHTEPESWDSNVRDGEGIATYDCQECGDEHRYLWGPPVPLLETEGEDEQSLFGDE